mgnify:CR=1 FL=1
MDNFKFNEERSSVMIIYQDMNGETKVYDSDIRRKEIINEATLKKMAIRDTDDPSLLTVEKIFSRLAEGRGADSVSLLKNSIKLRADQKSRA